MYKIYIDTTQRYEKSIKILDEDKKVVAEESGNLNIVPIINKFLEPADIEEIVPNPGPGSFTGIKIGITIANVVNWALGKKPLKKQIRPKYGSEPNIQTNT